MSVLFHPLGKLANVVKVVANLNMVVVDISASSHLVFIPGKVDLDFAPIGDAEQFLIVAVNEPDAFCRILHVPIEPVLDIAVAVKIVLALIRVQAQQIGVFVCIDTDTVIVLLGGHFALRIHIAVISEVLPVVKNTLLLLFRSCRGRRCFLRKDCTPLLLPKKEFQTRTRGCFLLRKNGAM